ncbi:unnamed protein product [Lactuca saligna]|uniref:Uncharacterized protein n=1 Tax=Lactuca saligna TaxID=75948 RepID=A0AA35ZRF9_LACSI|nr:unnamed protein product [Lactuca saligna]
MCVAFVSNSCSDSNQIQSQGFSHWMGIYNISDSTLFNGGNPWTSRLSTVKEEDDSSSSSSIGKNSDAGGGDSDDEVQSKDNGPLNQLNDLEKVLPIKRGISSFYAGKSKSYGNLADATSVQSIQDIVKPEDAYTRKRKNMIAHTVLFEKLRKSSTDSSDASKRLANSTTTGTHAPSLPPLPPNTINESSNSSSPSPSPSASASPSPRMYYFPWRSLSLSDLHHASSITDSVINERDKEDEH